MARLLATPEVLSAAEPAPRCDRCGAAAQLVTVLESGGELAFCGHHGRRHAAGLAPLTARVRVAEGFDWTAAARG